jgi:hypothetical protein
MKLCDENILKTLMLVEEMISIAVKGSADQEDDGCGILYGVLLDSAYKVKQLAEAEKKNTLKKGGGNRVAPGIGNGNFVVTSTCGRKICELDFTETENVVIVFRSYLSTEIVQ